MRKVLQMRKVVLLAVAGSLALAGVAYAATVTPKYILNGKVTPAKSGTRTHALPIAAQFGWKVMTSPPKRRPPVVGSYRFVFQGIEQNVKYFPACSTSTLNSTGPSGCRKGSQIGTGSFTVAVGPSKNTAIAGTCTAELSVFNGGGNDIILYVYTKTGAARQCVLPPPGEFAIPVGLYHTHGTRDLVEQFDVPYALRHPAPGVDAAILTSSITIAKRSVVIKSHGKKVVIGLFASEYCPPNHQRVIKGLFVPEHGPNIGLYSNKHVACS